MQCKGGQNIKEREGREGGVVWRRLAAAVIAAREACQGDKSQLGWSGIGYINLGGCWYCQLGAARLQRCVVICGACVGGWEGGFVADEAAGQS